MTPPSAMVTDEMAAALAKQFAPGSYVGRLLRDRERTLAALDDIHPLSLYGGNVAHAMHIVDVCLACDVQEEAGRDA